jgi:hypothetical protein
MAYSYQQRVRAIPLWLRIVLPLAGILPMMALGGYWWWSYTGLYRWLAELELGWFGAYYPGYTGVVELAVCLLLGAVPGGLLLFALVKLEVFPVDPANPPDVAAQDARTLGWLDTHIWRVFGLAGGIAALIGGSILTWSGLTAGALTTPDLAALEAGTAPPSRYVEVQGRLLWDRTLTHGPRGTVQPIGYVPLVSQGWQAGRPVVIYVRVNNPQDPALAGGPLTGTLSQDGLPGPVRTQFEEQGPPPTAPHYLLEVGNRPARNIDNGLGLLGVGGGLIAITAVAWLVIWLRQRRNQGRPLAGASS